jgi:uncharacterized membrane protein YfcA
MPPDFVVYLAALVLAGCLAGLLAGLLGVGGGIVTVPAVFHALAVTDADPAVRMHVAVATSLALIVPTAIRSALAHARRGAVDAALLRRWAVPVVAGTALGVWLATLLPGERLSLVFGGALLAIAAYLALVPEAWRLAERLPPAPGVYAYPIGIGALSAMMGIGGGSLTVPALTAHGYTAHRAVGTSAAFGLVIAVPGAVGFVVTGWAETRLPAYSVGYVSVPALVCILPTMLAFVPFGVRLAHRFPSRSLRRAFAAFLVLTGLRMLWAGAA